MNVYFDNAATTKVRDEVIDDISNVLKLKGNQIFLDINSVSFPLFFTLIFSLLFIQSFTSAPVFISMIFPIITMNYRFTK